MNATDSRGRTISLLNDDLPRLSNLEPSAKASRTLPLPRPQLSSSSSSSSCHSSSSQGTTPGLTPPSLSRTGSSEDSRPNPLSSPLTPPSCASSSAAYQRPDQHRKKPSDLPARPRLAAIPSHRKPSSMDPSFTSPDGSWAFAPNSVPVAFYETNNAPTAASVTAQLHHQSTSLDAQPPTQPPQQQPQSQAQLPQSRPQPQSQQAQQQMFPSSVTTPKSAQKKSSYPCPVAKQYNCLETFTTSGHAARHAKKHTGKKDAVCPECGKAFTRKDNMEQHRRTHANGRNAPSSNGTNGNASSSQPNNHKAPVRDVTEETKARKQRVQQRKARPSSISTGPPSAAPTSVAPPSATQPPLPVAATAPTPAQQPTVTMGVMPTQTAEYDMVVDPQLRDSPSSSTFFPTNSAASGADMSMQYHPHMQQFSVPMVSSVPQRQMMQNVMVTPQQHQQAMNNQAVANGQMLPGYTDEPMSPTLHNSLDTLALAASHQQ